ncbi:hypothetical protein M23134_01424 [Microscilla marina ATCC 23134]|uniref:Uncharacterized protein n=1 Tax=Microscilla marina ATCC 23134 TaxID=313606 RepID=A1ZJR5_MICM2|nr:hypothetical protein M23134_01424 [Microscilla marina ATCC 23134]
MFLQKTNYSKHNKKPNSCLPELGFVLLAQWKLQASPILGTSYAHAKLAPVL